VNSRSIHLNLQEPNHNIMLTSVLPAWKLLRIRKCLRFASISYLLEAGS
jgi:hypothetical protein